jgi:hypothetical protein
MTPTERRILKNQMELLKMYRSDDDINDAYCETREMLEGE